METKCYRKVIVPDEAFKRRFDLCFCYVSVNVSYLKSYIFHADEMKIFG